EIFKNEVPQENDKRQIENNPENRIEDRVSVLQELKQRLADCLFVELEDIDIKRDFIESGLDSIIGVEWIRDINKHYGIRISAIKIYDYPNLEEFSVYVDDFLAKEVRNGKDSVPSNSNVPDRNISLNELPQRKKDLSIEAVKPNKALANSSPFSLIMIRSDLKRMLSESLFMAESELIEDRTLQELGLDSIIGVEWVRDLNKKYNLSVGAVKVYDYPTLNLFSEYFYNELMTQSAYKGNGVVADQEEKQEEKQEKPSDLDLLLNKVQSGEINGDQALEIFNGIGFSE
ncbi:MAG: acyl carrier protein, partial [Flavobacteriales bacterium]|nr:acyl carrier protein [Flavobacteriales bacterium]